MEIKYKEYQTKKSLREIAGNQKMVVFKELPGSILEIEIGHLTIKNETPK
jgi:hypothetical protein